MVETSQSSALRQSPFHKFHQSRGAKMVDFTGWELPLHYGSIIDEHKHVRVAGGIFDVSHMGRLRFTGRDARAFLDRVCTRQILGMTDGQARYSMVCNEQGGCKDDVLVYRLEDHEYLMVCNAANRMKLLDHFESVRDGAVFELKDETESTGMIAIQGPRVMEQIGAVSSEVPALKRYRFTIKRVLFAKFLISRTGYTGEDGVEVIIPAKFAKQAMDLLLSAQTSEQVIQPAGLGARDSLRLEAGMALYGHEISEERDPISAGLNFAVKLNKGEADPEAGRFIGQEALQAIAAEGPRQRLVGLLLDGRRAARQDMTVLVAGRPVGLVTSGVLSPTLDKSIAMAYVESAHAESGVTVEVDLGRSTATATVTSLPFYSKP